MHAPVIFAASSPSTPLLPPAAPSPAASQQLADQPAAAQAATTQRLRLDSTRGRRLFPVLSLDPSDSLPHTLTNSAALSLTPPRPQTTPCLLPNNCDPLPDSKSPPVLRRSSPQTKRRLRTRTLNLNSLPSPVPRETATLRLPAGDWTQLHCSRECCSQVREVSSANRDACALCTEIW